MKILIAHDGSGCADAALDDLRYAGLPEVAEALVLTAGEILVQSPALATMGISSAYYFPDDAQVQALNENQQGEAQSVANRAADRLRAEFPKWHLEPLGEVDTPESAIVAKADSWKPDLLVVGSHGQSGFRRFFLGSVSKHVLNHTRCSVRVGRRHPHPQDQPIRLLFGADESPDAAAAMQAIAARQWPKDTEVRIVGVVDSVSWHLEPPLLAPDPTAAALAVEGSTSRMSQTVHQAQKRLAEAGLVATAQVLPGNPDHVLVAEAESWDADCIFVGAGGLNALERMLLGSVSNAVAMRAHCSVEVVRQPA